MHSEWGRAMAFSAWHEQDTKRPETDVCDIHRDQKMGTHRSLKTCKSLTVHSVNAFLNGVGLVAHFDEAKVQRRYKNSEVPNVRDSFHVQDPTAFMRGAAYNLEKIQVVGVLRAGHLPWIAGSFQFLALLSLR